MDKSNCTLEVELRQAFREIPLTLADRRVLLGASLRLLVRKFGCGQPIFQNDVIRAASLADDAVERAA